MASVAAVAALTACEDPVRPGCQGTSVQQQEVRGDTVVLTSGLRYIDTGVGTGPVVQDCRGVAVHYTGFLTNGTKFDSSRDRNQVFAFTPGFREVIAGFEQGVIGMRVGGTRRLIIPPSLGYGNQQVGTIPPNSTLIFDVEVLRVEE